MEYSKLVYLATRTSPEEKAELIKKLQALSTEERKELLEFARNNFDGPIFSKLQEQIEVSLLTSENWYSLLSSKYKLPEENDLKLSDLECIFVAPNSNQNDKEILSKYINTRGILSINSSNYQSNLLKKISNKEYLQFLSPYVFEKFINKELSLTGSDHDNIFLPIYWALNIELLDTQNQLIKLFSSTISNLEKNDKLYFLSKKLEDIQRKTECTKKSPLIEYLISEIENNICNLTEALKLIEIIFLRDPIRAHILAKKYFTKYNQEIINATEKTIISTYYEIIHKDFLATANKESLLGLARSSIKLEKSELFYKQLATKISICFKKIEEFDQYLDTRPSSYYDDLGDQLNYVIVDRATRQLNYPILLKHLSRPNTPSHFQIMERIVSKNIKLDIQSVNYLAKALLRNSGKIDKATIVEYFLNQSYFYQSDIQNISIVDLVIDEDFNKDSTVIHKRILQKLIQKNDSSNKYWTDLYEGLRGSRSVYKKLIYLRSKFEFTREDIFKYLDSETNEEWKDAKKVLFDLLPYVQ